jgi:hypothetical protein
MKTIPYDPKYHPAQIRQLIGFGLKHDEVTAVLGLTRSQWIRWNKRVKAVRDAVKDGRAAANSKVAQSLFRKATGSTLRIVTKTVLVCPHCHQSAEHQVPHEVPTEPNVVAAIFWLKCRAGWRDTQALEITDKTMTEILRERNAEDLSTSANQKQPIAGPLKALAQPKGEA